MGAGKSAVGRTLARMLHMEFLDSDDEIEARTGVDIGFIFEKEGEDGFRKREITAIEKLSTRDDIVLATGGGAVMSEENRNRLGARGFVIYLYASVDQQVARTSRGRDRPLLRSGDPRETLEELLAVRDPLYREIADLVVDTDGRKVNAVANEIVDAL
jgi:shikimate kinase